MTKRSVASELNLAIYLVAFAAVFTLLWLGIWLIGALLPLLKVAIPLGLLWWFWQRQQTRQQQQQAILDQAFYQLLGDREGYLTLLDFAMTAKLSPSLARQYLDNRAKDFSAQFGITETGDVFYIFPISRSAPFAKGRSES